MSGYVNLGFRYVVIATAAIHCLAGCNRSAQFKRDRDYYTGNEPSYYNRPGRGLASDQVVNAIQPKKRVFVFGFWNDTPVKPSEIGNFAADELKRGLFQSEKMIVPTDVNSALNTEDFLQNEKVKVAQLVREGRKLGVGVMVIGRVTRLVFRQKGDEIGLLRQKLSVAAADVEVKVYDVNSGREVASSLRSGEASSNANVSVDISNAESLASSNAENIQFRQELTQLAVRKAINQSVFDVVRAVEKLHWEGRVAKVTGTRVYLNAGKKSGIVAGDILKVMTQSEDVYDPASGAFLGRAPGQMKGTAEVLEFIGPDGAVAEVHTGGNFQEGDPVQLY